tara:strand:+ start:206 stop:532 length:327 start_codon:yes stop_codon:yes gene_type:complete
MRFYHYICETAGIVNEKNKILVVLKKKLAIDNITFLLYKMYNYNIDSDLDSFLSEFYLLTVASETVPGGIGIGTVGMPVGNIRSCPPLKGSFVPSKLGGSFLSCILVM